jgi:hypothetical protein
MTENFGTMAYFLSLERLALAKLKHSMLINRSMIPSLRQMEYQNRLKLWKLNMHVLDTE